MSIDLVRLRERISAVPEQLGCHVWLGSISQDGRPTIWDPAKQQPVSVIRVLWEATYGPIPPDFLLLHQCHRRWCVAVGHAAIGPASANAVGMAALERSAVGRGRGGGRGNASRLPAGEQDALGLRAAQAVRERHRRHGVQPQLFAD